MGRCRVAVGAGVSGPLPAAVRAQVVAFAADTLVDLSENEVPSALAAVRRFTPSRRAKLGATPLAAAMETDQVFRGRVAERVRLAMPDLVASLESEGGAPAAASPDEVAAVAYVLRLPGWEHHVGAAVQEAEGSAASARVAEAEDTIRRLTEQVDALRREARAESAMLRDRLGQARAEADEARRQLRASSERVRRAETGVADAVKAAEAARDAALESARAAEIEARRLKTRLAEAEAGLALARRGAREARVVDDARLRVLLDTLTAAAAGVRTELALPSGVPRPADMLASPAPSPFAALGARGLSDDDPGLVDEVLAVPGIHLIVDGYNVTKRGYGTLTLEAQRARLLSGISGLAGRLSSGEVTVVFDATAVASRPVGVISPRGVRVVFSLQGQLADEEIIRMVRAEPPGRPVAVVTSDREIADAVRAAGARPVPSAALLTRLERG